MTVGIFRSRIFTAGRAFLRDGRGVSAVETAFAFPVILAAFFIIVEFANMALTIQVGESAVSSALLRFRDAGELGASAENDIRQGIAAYSSCKSSKDHSKPRNEVDTSLKSPV